MTTFEFSILVILCSIVILIIFRSYVIVQEIHDICRLDSRLDSKLQNIVEYLGELTDIVDKMHRNLCVEIADKMVDRVYPPTYNPPCYAPNGICTNPQMDCISCPKRSAGGTWSTGTNINKND